MNATSDTSKAQATDASGFAYRIPGRKLLDTQTWAMAPLTVSRTFLSIRPPNECPQETCIASSRNAPLEIPQFQTENLEQRFVMVKSNIHIHTWIRFLIDKWNVLYNINCKWSMVYNPQLVRVKCALESIGCPGAYVQPLRKSVSNRGKGQTNVLVSYTKGIRNFKESWSNLKR